MRIKKVHTAFRTKSLATTSISLSVPKTYPRVPHSGFFVATQQQAHWWLARNLNLYVYGNFH